MALETGTYISDLVATNPAAADGLAQGDDHIRLIKATLKATFPNIAGAVTPTHTVLNGLDGRVTTLENQGEDHEDRISAVEAAYLKKDGSIALVADLNLGGHKIISLATPSANQDAANKAYVDTKAATVFTGASASQAGAVGAVPAPAAGDQEKFLRGDGTWQSIVHPVVQVAYTQLTSALSNQNGYIVTDSSVPQSNEGAQAMSLSFTPKKSTNKLKIEVLLWASCTGDAPLIAALFRSGNSNALAAAAHDTYDVEDGCYPLPITYWMDAGTTSAITFSVRYGTQNDPSYVNRTPSGATLGGRFVSTMTITEYSD